MHLCMCAHTCMCLYICMHMWRAKNCVFPRTLHLRILAKFLSEPEICLQNSKLKIRTVLDTEQARGFSSFCVPRAAIRARSKHTKVWFLFRFQCKSWRSKLTISCPWGEYFTYWAISPISHLFLFFVLFLVFGFLLFCYFLLFWFVLFWCVLFLRKVSLLPELALNLNQSFLPWLS